MHEYGEKYVHTKKKKKQQEAPYAVARIERIEPTQNKATK